MEEWRLIEMGYYSGAMNMAVDEAITTVMSSGEGPPTLRFYGWAPACLSLGYAQRFTEVNPEACRKQGIDVVRRPTGGRAILHDREVTYSVIAPEENALVSGTILQSYLKISRGLLFGLQKLGIQAEIVGHKDPNGLGTAACFDSPSFYELVIGGRKAVGSAQTRKNGILLQHGSIIRELDADVLFELLEFPHEAERVRLKQAFRRKACALQEAAGRVFSDHEIVEAVTAGFAAAFGVKLVNGELTPEEQALAERLAESKYGRAEWSQKR
ncbi:MAG TPA: biotin/lipoate A/B protein ligase family protein [Desulfobacteria bacterium]|nr:biotin/lipoate A/B protein ligase family protein [Desulfobacteria bacterium]